MREPLFVFKHVLWIAVMKIINSLLISLLLLFFQFQPAFAQEGDPNGGDSDSPNLWDQFVNFVTGEDNSVVATASNSPFSNWSPDANAHQGESFLLTYDADSRAHLNTESLTPIGINTIPMPEGISAVKIAAHMPPESKWAGYDIPVQPSQVQHLTNDMQFMVFATNTNQYVVIPDTTAMYQMQLLNQMGHETPFSGVETSDWVVAGDYFVEGQYANTSDHPYNSSVYEAFNVATGDVSDPILSANMPSAYGSLIGQNGAFDMDALFWAETKQQVNSLANVSALATDAEFLWRNPLLAQTLSETGAYYDSWMGDPAAAQGLPTLADFVAAGLILVYNCDPTNAADCGEYRDVDLDQMADFGVADNMDSGILVELEDIPDCPSDQIEVGEISVSGEKLEPNYVIVVGQDPDKRGVDLYFKVTIAPTIHTWYERIVHQITACVDVDGSDECEEVVVDQWVECVEHRDVYPEGINYVVASANLSSGSRAWVTQQLASYYINARLYHPDWSWVGGGSRGFSGSTFIWERYEYQVPVRDPGTYLLAVRGGTTGTAVTGPRAFNQGVGLFPAHLMQARIVGGGD